MNSLQKIAMVIDADNTQISKIEAVIREISKHGRIVVKRAYGNWKKDTLKNWEGEIKRLAIKAEQQFDYVSGKNATDMALVIDTIELLYANIYDAFVIVSSDSDYTPLAIKLHESGVYVMGVGERKRRRLSETPATSLSFWKISPLRSEVPLRRRATGKTESRKTGRRSPIMRRRPPLPESPEGRPGSRREVRGKWMTLTWRKFISCCALPTIPIRTTTAMSMSARRGLLSSGRSLILTPEPTAL